MRNVKENVWGHVCAPTRRPKGQRKKRTTWAESIYYPAENKAEERSFMRSSEKRLGPCLCANPQSNNSEKKRKRELAEKSKQNVDEFNAFLGQKA